MGVLQAGVEKALKINKNKWTAGRRHGEFGLLSVGTRGSGGARANESPCRLQNPVF